MSSLLIDDASQAKSRIYRMNKTADIVTIHATMKTRWFFHFNLLKKALYMWKLHF